jgi:L,D-transpeptidase catalytic domain
MVNARRCALLLFAGCWLQVAGAAADVWLGQPGETGIAYRLRPTPQSLGELRSMFTPQQLTILEKLNRRDARHLVQLERMVAPSVWTADPLDYAPLPETYARVMDYPKALVVYKPTQSLGAYEYGHLVRWGPVSTGREQDRTPSGLFHLTWRSPGRHSSVDPDWYMPWYFNFDNDLGLAFHAYTLPGYPASHGCIRLLQADAKWLYGWGEEWKLDETGQAVLEPGTPVFVIGAYDFAAAPPWRSTQALAKAATLPEHPLRLAEIPPQGAERSGS